MKTIKNIFPVALIAVLSLSITSTVTAQMSPYKFDQLFQQAFAQVVEGNHEDALPILERLYHANRTHAQVAYLYGVCRMNSNDQDLAVTRKVLEVASANFDYRHRYGCVEDKSAPVKVWFHLAEVNARENRVEKAIESYRNYMSCIPLASLNHKRMVKDRISELKEQRLANTKSNENELLANVKP